MDLSNPPTKYWHCLLKLPDKKEYAVVNDLSFEELERTILKPWHSGRPFTVSGTVVRSNNVSEIKITHTAQPKEFFAERHNASMRQSGIADMATDRRLLPISNGVDATFDLLFSGQTQAAPEPEAQLVKRVCSRIAQAARIIESPRRKGKSPFAIDDEYDAQDLLHAILRAYLKYSVQENPLPKVAASKSSRADISIEELGILIEVKFVHGPEDQKRIFEEYSQDLVLYAQWPFLKTLLFVIYNSADLRDAEAFEKLSAVQEISGKRFEVQVVLA